MRLIAGAKEEEAGLLLEELKKDPNSTGIILRSLKN